jgi:hypothetical protein
MQHKDIKATVIKQLKKEYPEWKQLTKAEKKKIARLVLDEAVAGYDPGQPVVNPPKDLLGLSQQQVTARVMNLEQMSRFIDQQKNSRLFHDTVSPSVLKYIKDEELKIIDKLLDDDIINRLLSYEGYTPSMRDYSPNIFLRAELLKAIKYPEISYRKFCGDDKNDRRHKINNPYTGVDQKQNRIFIGLPLRRHQMLHHVQLSQFRNSLTFSQLVNLTVYILHQFRLAGLLDMSSIHCVDSTELAVDCQRLLAAVTINGRKIRIYDDLDSDCGKRRNKRDKSVYVVGYRLHTLSAINPETGHSYPLISLLAPANHHDSNFLLPLIQLGKAIGLDLQLVTADEAYHDKSGSMLAETGVHLIKPPGSKASVPDNVDIETMSITFDDLCEQPMAYVGSDDRHHEFKCNAEPGECFRSDNCPRVRQIPFDNGYFQPLFYGIDGTQEAMDIRKNGERPFNLLKNREGLDAVRVRSQHGLLARSTFATMATLLIEIAGTRRKKKKEKKPRQFELPAAAA